MDFTPGLAVRDAALEALLRNDAGEGFVSETLGRIEGLSGRDRGLALEIALTTIRAKALLDHHLEPCLRGPTDPGLLWILRMAVAQVKLLDRIPAHAAGDLAVCQARHRAGQSASGFVNAVLRRSFRAPLLLPEGDDAASLAVTYSHPQWLVERWLQRFDVETTISMMQASNAPPPVWVRVRKGASSLPWTDADVQETALDGLFVRLDGGREALLNSASFARGDISFQDPSSGEAALRLVPYLKPGQILVDLCSAPGGKIACLRDAGLLTGIQPLALDLSMVRQQRTRSGFQRLGLKATVAVSDGVEPPVKPSSVDAILLDAPCSNLGVLGRRPEARWRVVPRELAEHALLQKQLLAKALELLKPGGVVVYSTCSVEPEETEQVVASVSETCEVVEQFTRLPTPGGWDGFFAAVLRKS